MHSAERNKEAKSGPSEVVVNACKAYWDKACPNMEYGPEHKACVDKNMKSFSEGCTTAMKAGKGKGKKKGGMSQKGGGTDQ